MAEDRDVVWLHAERQVTIADLSESCGLPEEVLRELVEYGALHPRDPGSDEWCFSAECVVSLRTAARLRSDLELETPAMALVLAFLERIERLEARIRSLDAELSRPHR